MNTPVPAEIRAVLILKADRLYAEIIRQSVAEVFPKAQINVVTTVQAANEALANCKIDLFITGLGTSLDGDVLDLLGECLQRESKPGQVMVVTTRREYRLLVCLRSLDIAGVFDSGRETSELFQSALRTVAAGSRYWSPSILHLLQAGTSGVHSYFRQLTPFEQLVFAVVGDGCDDTAAATSLGLSPSTISTVRRELHRKLGVQHRGELVRMAAQHGYVRFTPTGVVRPGYALLAAAYNARKAKRSTGAAPLALPARSGPSRAIR